ncbi:BatD family protein [Ningiella sp. W23]|uniref:BatD family protein n=1 Tax=Ningiella sp. W23 TaxID=3023715 RepID=UPI003756A5C2
MYTSLTFNRVLQLTALMFCFSTWHALAQVSELTASVSKNPILADEAVTLQVSATGDADRDAIDFSVLTQDFRVSQPSVSQSTQIINFNRTQTISWTLQLFPRREGKLTIPSFAIDGQASAPIIMDVLPVGQATQAQPRDFFVTTSVTSDEVFLQQQVLYTVKIYLAGDIQRGSLSEPVLDGAVIEQLGEDSEYQELLNGVRYRVIERNFAVLPQASGVYTIDGPVFQAEVLSNTRQSFAFFNRSKTISRVAPPQNIIVKPIPESYQYTWLPSEQVQIDEEWQGSNDNFVQGEPITRTVTLTALGLIEEQLPMIEPRYHPSFKTYPEQAEKATVERNNRLIAQLVQSTAIIPSEVGSFVLPEISVPWFDVNSGETRFATLPARTINVVAPAATVGVTTPDIMNEDMSASVFDEAIQTGSGTERGYTDTSRFPIVLFGLDLLHIILMLALVILSLIMLYMRNAYQYRRNTPPVEEQSAAKVSLVANEQDAWLKLGDAIDSNNHARLQLCLRNWLSLILNKDIHSINAAFRQLKAEDAARTYNETLASQYSQSKDSHPDSIQDFKTQLNAVRDKLQNTRDMQKHTSMYPIH